MNDKSLPSWVRMILTDLLTLCRTATIAVCAGLFINQFRDQPLSLLYQSKVERMGSAVEKIAADGQSTEIRVVTASLPEYLSLEEFQKYISGRLGLIIDARPEIFHRLGHVPDALSLPREDFENAYASLRGKLEANRSQPIVVYCARASCGDSELVRKGLLGLNYTNVGIFRGGWSEWESIGMEVEKSQ